MNARRILLKVALSVLFAGCAEGADEAFSVGIPSHTSKPRLASARLDSSEPGLSYIGPGDTFVYSRGSNLRLPEETTLVWTVKGEEAEHRAEFTLRQQIPSEVFQLIGSRKRPLHTLFIDFRVIGGRPECEWKYFRFEGKGISDGTDSAEEWWWERSCETWNCAGFRHRDGTAVVGLWCG